MLMRKKSIRGETRHLLDGTPVITLEVHEKDFVKVILPDGKINAVAKTALDLPLIDTKNYEKVVGD